MAQGNVGQAIATQHEAMPNEVPLLILDSAPLWKEIKTVPTTAVSNRPIRVAYQVTSAGDFSAVNLDGGDLGRGTAPTTVYGNLSCVSFIQGSEYTTLSQMSTDTSAKSIANYVSKTNEGAQRSFLQYLDALVCYGDGANTIDTVVSTTTNGFVTTNANKFQANQRVDDWSAVGGTNRGTVRVLSVDISNNTVWLDGPTPAGAAAGDSLIVTNSAGIANSGLLGLLAYNAPGNAGNYTGVNKSTYPGLFSTSSIDLAGGALTPAAVRATEARVRLAIGEDRANTGGLVAHTGIDVQTAWENNSTLVSRVIMNEVKGDQAVDMLKPKAPTMIAGRRMIVNERATPGRIDWLALKFWQRFETVPMQKFDIGGQTLFPVYGDSGGVAASMLFYWEIMTQLWNSEPRAGAVTTGIQIPHYFFGR